MCRVHGQCPCESNIISVGGGDIQRENTEVAGYPASKESDRLNQECQTSIIFISPLVKFSVMPP